MTTYARIVDGRAQDVVVTPPALSERFHPEWLAKQNFVVIPDGAVSGAIDNGNGTFTNPPPPPVYVPQDAALSWPALSNYLVGLLGGGTAGRTALGVIIKSCQASPSGADNFFAAYLQGNGSFTKAEFISVLADVSAAIVSAPQKTVVANSWPKA